MDAPATLEFDVKMTCGKCVKAVKQAFQDVQGVKSLDVNLEKGQVVVQTNLSSERVKNIIESSGRLAVLKGMGGQKVGNLFVAVSIMDVGSDMVRGAIRFVQTDNKTLVIDGTLDGLQPVGNLGAAVSIMDVGSDMVRGVIRFVQTDNKTLVIDGTLDGLQPGKHALFVHECGDISNGCYSCGGLFGRTEMGKKAAGDIGDVEPSKDGRAEFRFMTDRLKVSDLIGRSMMIHSCSSEQVQKARDKNTRLSCGIIARSAGLFENTKKICACDGVTLWDERNRPIAGPGRQSQANL